MQADVTIKTEKGFYHEVLGFHVRNVHTLGEDLLKQLDKIPSEIDGEKSYNWIEMNITLRFPR